MLDIRDMVLAEESLHAAEADLQSICCSARGRRGLCNTFALPVLCKVQPQGRALPLHWGVLQMRSRLHMHTHAALSEGLWLSNMRRRGLVRKKVNKHRSEVSDDVLVPGSLPHSRYVLGMSLQCLSMQGHACCSPSSRTLLLISDPS